MLATVNLPACATCLAAENKPQISNVADMVDEGLGEEFEDTPWVPPTVKRVWFG